MKKNYLFLTLIFLLAAFLRFWQLGDVPISPDWDEAALGYNAYSIIETGKDEYGEFLPVVLRSFDDYKPALYMYLIIPFIFMFDVSTYAVRFPSALLGTLTVLATFFLVREVFTENKKRDFISLLTSLLLAISPWHIQFSRIAFESNAGVSFNVFSALFFMLGLRKPKLLFLSAIFAGLSIYTYQSDKVFTPLLILLLLIVYMRKFISLQKRYVVGFFVVGILVVLPMFFYLITNQNALMRVQGTSVFADKTQLLEDNVSKLNYDIQTKNDIGKVFDNRRVTYLTTILSGYLSHYNLNWLFIRGDLTRHHAPNMGLMYLFELPFLLLGVYYLFFGQYSKTAKLFVFGWFLIAPIPASITSGVPHAVRTLNFLPSFQIITAIGIISSFVYLSRYLRLKNILLTLLVFLAIFNFGYYLNQYFVQQNYYTAHDWQYGWKETVEYVKGVEENYEKIIVTDKQPLDRSYMFFAFYLKYPPQKYQEETKGQSGGFGKLHEFSKYTFRDLDWEKDSQNENTLIIGGTDEIPNSSSIKKTINYPNGEPAILIVEP